MRWLQLSTTQPDFVKVFWSDPGYTFYVSICPAKECPTLWLDPDGLTRPARMVYLDLPRFSGQLKVVASLSRPAPESRERTLRRGVAA